MKHVCKYEVARVVFVVVERGAAIVVVTVLTAANSNNRSDGNNRCSSLYYRTMAGMIGRVSPIVEIRKLKS